MVYRITIQKVNPDNSLGELIEILETERESWTSVFDFVDDYRREHADTGEDEPDISEAERDGEVGVCPDCERPNQFGELCVSCQREREADLQDRWTPETARQQRGGTFGS